MSGTHVLVGGERCRVVGAVSMDALAVELPRDLPRGTEVTLVGPGVPLEEHARVADTINWEIVSRIESGPARATRVVV
jgi:alanine racemase